MAPAEKTRTGRLGGGGSLSRLRRAFSGYRSQDDDAVTEEALGSASPLREPLPPGGESALVDLSEGFGEGDDFDVVPMQNATGAFGEANRAPHGFDFLQSRGYDAHDAGASAPFAASAAADAQSRIRVLVRKRPLNGKEVGRGESDILAVDPHNKELIVHAPRVKVDLTRVTELHTFSFDGVFDDDASNNEVYEDAVEPLIPAVLTGCRATVFAYGQTGSGKTYTMTPIPLQACMSLMQNISDGIDIWVSYYEIYGGKVFDLLNERNHCPMREDGKKNVKIVGLREAQLQSYDHFQKLIDRGAAARSTGSTGANSDSSRSHAVMNLNLRAANGLGAKAASQRGGLSGCLVDERHLRADEVVGSIAFIDLAGSERGKDTSDNDVQTRMEGAEINRSLLALKECIRALDHKKGHVPFRGSKLTEALRDSFVGNSRTVMIAAVSPGDSSCEHTLNTLRYADRVRELGDNDGPTQSNSSRGIRGPRVERLVHNNPDLEAARAGLGNGWQKLSHYQSAGNAMGRTNSRKQVESKEGGNRSFAARGQQEAAPAPALTSVMERVPSHALEIVPSNGTARGTGKKGEGPRPESPLAPSMDDVEATMELVAAHRRHIDELMSFMQQEMVMLQGVDDTPEAAVDGKAYAATLREVLKDKTRSLRALQDRVDSFLAGDEGASAPSVTKRGVRGLSAK